MGEKSKSKSKEDPTFRCVERMADKLKKFEGSRALVFEKSNVGVTVIDGIIREMQENGQILHMEDAVKTVTIPGSIPLVFPTFPDLYISVCEVTSFSPTLTPITPTTQATPVTTTEIDANPNEG